MNLELGPMAAEVIGTSSSILSTCDLQDVLVGSMFGLERPFLGADTRCGIVSGG